jgi:hypothetical protein
MSVLSLSAISRLAERHVRQAGGQPVPGHILCKALEDERGIPITQARAGIALGVLMKRLVHSPSGVTVPAPTIPLMPLRDLSSPESVIAAERELAARRQRAALLRRLAQLSLERGAIAPREFLNERS